jgi:hypothetical protein
VGPGGGDTRDVTAPSGCRRHGPTPGAPPGGGARAAGSGPVVSRRCTSAGASPRGGNGVASACRGAVGRCCDGRLRAPRPPARRARPGPAKWWAGRMPARAKPGAAAWRQPAEVVKPAGTAAWRRPTEAVRPPEPATGGIRPEAVSPADAAAGGSKPDVPPGRVEAARLPACCPAALRQPGFRRAARPRRNNPVSGLPPGLAEATRHPAGLAEAPAPGRSTRLAKTVRLPAALRASGSARPRPARW